MRSPIGQALRKQFASELAQRLPEFRKGRKELSCQRPIWTVELAPDLTVFIELVPLRRSDEFVVEVGWTDNDNVLVNYSQGPIDTRAHKWGTRLSDLFAPNYIGYEPTWSVAPPLSEEEEEKWHAARRRGEVISFLPPPPPVEEILHRVGPLVKDAVDKIVIYAMPIFRRVAEERGLSWPSTNAASS
jgi:hypothetical protein